MSLIATIFNNPQLGHFALSSGCALELSLAFCAFAAAYQPNKNLTTCARAIAVLAFICIVFSLFSLMGLYAFDNFSVKAVYQNSSRAQPMFFKITGTWGNHEGSTLLWVTILSFYGAIAACLKKPYFKNYTLAIMGVLTFLFALFCETSSNPFFLLDSPATDGSGINVLLQDVGLAIHPPILYAGYVGLSLAYATAAACLLEGNLTQQSALLIKKVTLVAWSFLTAGIALGSWWSYYVLGWGGYWFWDPVENASLIPWLSAAALIHALVAFKKNQTLKVWVLFLSLISFSFAVSGTFLVRSGILNSVHAFAADPRRGIFILFLLGIVLGAGILLLAYRLPRLQEKPKNIALVSRESELLINNALFMILCIIVLFGTLYPAIIQLITNQSISVGKPFFDKACAPFAYLILIGTGLSFVVPWQKTSFVDVLQKIKYGAAISVLSIAIGYFITKELWSAISIGLCVWIVACATSSFVSKTTTHLPIGVAISHLGAAICMLGIIGMSKATSDIVQIPVNSSVSLAGKEWKLDDVTTVQNPDYVAYRATITISDKNHTIYTLHPERRFFLKQRQANSFVAIRTNLIADYYAVLSKPQMSDGHREWILRLHYNPLAPFIWMGAGLIALGGFLSIKVKKLFRMPTRHA